jgi:hypothetical protein
MKSRINGTIWVSTTWSDAIRQMVKVCRLILTTPVKKSVMKEGYSACQSDVMKISDVRRSRSDPDPALTST